MSSIVWCGLNASVVHNMLCSSSGFFGTTKSDPGSVNPLSFHSRDEYSRALSICWSSSSVYFSSPWYSITARLMKKVIW